MHVLGSGVSALRQASRAPITPVVGSSGKIDSPPCVDVTASVRPSGVIATPLTDFSAVYWVAAVALQDPAPDTARGSAERAVGGGRKLVDLRALVAGDVDGVRPDRDLSGQVQAAGPDARPEVI